MAERWITKLSTGIQVTLLLNKYLLSLITSTQWIILRVNGVTLQKTKNITILFLKGTFEELMAQLMARETVFLFVLVA